MVDGDSTAASVCRRHTFTGNLFYKIDQVYFSDSILASDFAKSAIRGYKERRKYGKISDPRGLGKI